MIEILVTEHKLSVRAACRAIGLSRTAYYRPPVDWLARDGEVITALQTIVERRPRWGFWKCFDRLHLDGQPWNHKRVLRVYRAMRLNLPRRAKRRVPTRLRQPMGAPLMLNDVWALDFMHDRLYSGRPFRTLNVIDEANREGLAVEVGASIPASRVVRVLEQLIEMHGKPTAIRCDNGPELTSQHFADWAESLNIEIRYIQPGKPDQNAYVERFNRSYREEVLDAYLFDSVEEAQDLSDQWLADYNENRPHDALGGILPALFLPRVPKLETSTLRVCA